MRLAGAPRSAHEADVVVAGSGLPPLAAALELARRGVRVVLAREASALEAASPLGLLLLGPGRPYSEVVRALGRPAARLVWAAGCENRLRAKAFVEGARRACGFEERGSFLLARDRRQAEQLEQSEDLLRDDGFPGEFLDHYMLETRFDLSGFRAAYWAAGDALLDAPALAAALEDAAREARVVFEPARVRALQADASGVRVELETGSLRCAAGVVASDAPVARLLPELFAGVGLATLASASLPPLPGASLPSAARTADARIAWQRSGGSFLVAETGPRGAAADDALRDFATRLPLAVERSQRGPSPGPPAIAEEPLECSLDGLPLVGMLPGRPLAVACGFGRLSPGLAFAAARWVADALVRGTDPTPEALRASRALRAGSV